MVPFVPGQGWGEVKGGLGGPDDPDPRPIILFDLNGTLTSHTAKRRSAGVNKMRPGTRHLRRLQVRLRDAPQTAHESVCVLNCVML